MATNLNMAKREISTRERVQKTLAGIAVYGLGAAAIWYLNDGWPERPSAQFLAAVTLSVVWVAFIIRFATQREDSAATKEQIQMVRMRIADDRAGRTWVSRIGLNAKLLLCRALFLLGLAIAAVGVFIFGKQCYTFATEKIWLPVSVLQFFGSYLEWLATKDIWESGQLFLQTVLHWLSAAFVLVMVGAAVALRALAAMDTAKERAIARRKDADRDVNC